MVGKPDVDPRIERVIADELAERWDESTVTLTVLRNSIKVRALRHYPTSNDQDDPEYIDWPSDKTLDRLIDWHDPKKRRSSLARTRRTEGNRPDRPFRPIAATYPGEVVEMDSTPLDLLVRMPDGVEAKPTLTVLFDVATRSILGWSITAAATGAHDLTELIARTLRPRQCRPDAPDWMRLDKSPVLPHAEMTALDERQQGAIAMPYIVPTMVTTDRGMDYMSETLLSAFARFGIDVVQAPPHSPAAKPHVERNFRSIRSLWTSYMEWYVAEGTHHRGQAMRGDAIDFYDITTAFEEWVVRVWQNRSHAGNVGFEHPGKRFTPNQMYAALFDGSPGAAVPISIDDYISLMPKVERVIGADGVHLFNEVYDCGDLQPFRGRKAHTRTGKWEVRFDPYDRLRIWVATPDGSWVECLSRSVRRLSHPFGEAAVAFLDGATPASTSVQDMWAQETLTKQASRKANKEAAARRARSESDEPRPAPLTVARVEPDRSSASQEFTVPTGEEDLWNEA